MNYRKLLLPGFIIMVLMQLYVPAKMIWDKETVVVSGVEYKFKTAPVDPADPFRGKYIRLRYDSETVVVDTTLDWERGELVYAVLNNDEDGFAKIDTLLKEQPNNGQDYISVEVRYASSPAIRKRYPSRNYKNTILIKYPFDRFYMEESKAYDAEVSAREARIDTTNLIYALINVKDGDSVLRDVLIDGVPIQEVVKTKQQEKPEPEKSIN